MDTDVNYNLIDPLSFKQLFLDDYSYQTITGLKKVGLFAGQFLMVGPIENPKTELNTLSFAPGILRDIFAEDWLNDKNFFLGNKVD